MNTSLPNKIEFVFHSVKTEEFATIPENFDLKSTVSVDTNIDIKVNESDKIIGVFLTFQYLQKKKVFLKIKVACNFSVVDTYWAQLIDTKDNQLKLPKGFITHLLMLSIGTVRGILVAKTEGTVYSQFVLPTMNISEKIKNDFVIEIGNKKELA